MSRIVSRLGCIRFGISFKISGILSKMSNVTSAVDASSPTDGESRKRPLEDAEVSDSKKQCLEVDRIKKRKVALLMSYSGQGYLGMQRNPGMKTIEDDLLSALWKAGYITEDAFNTPQVIQFQRAARTDKGVSAARQVVSLKLPEGTKVELINEYLPEQIRVMAIKRVTKGFNSKSSCSARTYSYMLPTFAFTPPDTEINETYRITPQVLEDVRTTLKVFEGTHNFHNFTARKKPLDPSANRYIMNFEMDDPIVKKDVEFCVIRVKGQSFMLHQIRKMVGLTIAVARGHTNLETLQRAWKTERLDLPVAPGLGLVLEEVHYDRYNEKFGKDGIHEPLEWAEVEDQISSFKDNYIFSVIINSEIEEKSMLQWLETLPLHSYSIREDNLSHGLTTLGQAAKLMEEVEEDGDGLATLARAAHAVQQNQNMCNGVTKEHADIPST